MQAQVACESQLPFNEFANQFLQQNKFDMASVQEQLDALRFAALSQNDCLCEEYAICLGVGLKLYDVSLIDTFSQHCSTTLPDVEYILGSKNFNLADFESAMRHYERALALGVDSTICLSSMAWTAIKLKNLEKAQQLGRTAYGRMSATPHPQTLTIYLLLAEIQLLQGHFSSAMDWTAELDNVLTKMPPFNYKIAGQMLIANAEEQNEFNRLRCQIGLRDTIQAKNLWNRVSWGTEAIDAQLQLLTIEQTAEFLGSSTIINLLEKPIESLFTRIGQSEKSELGCFSLLDPEFRESQFPSYAPSSIWKWANESCKIMGHSAGQSRAAEATLVSGFPSFRTIHRRIAQWAVTLLALAFFARIMHTIQKRRKQSAVDVQGELQIIRDYLTKAVGHPQAVLATLQSLDSMVKNRSNLAAQPFHNRLDAIELEVLNLLQKNIPPKEIARLKGWSPGHVYNITSLIRKKLNIESDLTLSDWLKTQ